MEQNKDRLSIDVAKLYYKSDYSQQQIANKLNLSRPTVSRLLQYAKEKGFVQINIADPIEDNSSLEEALCEKYNLDVVKIAYAPLNTTNEIKKSISMKAADYLYEIVKDGDIIGVSWGTTIYNMALNLKHKALKGVQIVQLKGGISHSQSNTYAYEVVELFSEAFSTVGRYLPLPVMFDTAQIKELIERDKHIKKILDKETQTNNTYTQYETQKMHHDHPDWVILIKKIEILYKIEQWVISVQDLLMLRVIFVIKN